MNDERKLTEILQNIQEQPEQLFDLTPRQFEEVIAELLANFGWDVSLTRPTKDGGYDILAVNRDSSGLETTWIVECKKYRPGNKVGVEIVRSLSGVKAHLGVSNALLVTSSEFSKGSKQLADSRYDLHLIEYFDLLNWLKQYRISSEEKPHFEDRRFYSCFISYSHKDKDFSEKLNSRLRHEGVKVWYAPEDMMPGQKINDQIKSAIGLFDKLIIVLSKESMKSEWVKTEIRNAKQREAKEGCQVLFPITLVPIKDIKNWECFDSDIGKDMAVELREYHIPDFSNWKNEKSFEGQFQKVIASLRAADENRRKVEAERSDTLHAGEKSFTDGDWITAGIVGPEKAVTILQRIASKTRLTEGSIRDEQITMLETRVISQMERLQARYELGGSTAEQRLEACIAKVVSDILDRELNSFLWNANENNEKAPMEIFRDVIRGLM